MCECANSVKPVNLRNSHIRTLVNPHICFWHFLHFLLFLLPYKGKIEDEPEPCFLSLEPLSGWCGSSVGRAKD